MRKDTQFTVNLSYLQENYSVIKSFTPKSEVLFMVKANAYGHGLCEVTRYAVQELGIKEFGVATLSEALCLRKELNDLNFEIYVFSELNLKNSEDLNFYLDFALHPVISNLKDLDLILQATKSKYLPLVLKFNTGMNRLGIDVEFLIEVIEKLKKSCRTHVYHLMSHFSCSSLSIKKTKITETQAQKFQYIKQELKHNHIQVEKTSIANSGAIEQGHSISESHIRPGLILYGPSSLIPTIRAESLVRGKIISRLTANILAIRRVQKGEPIGYGAKVVPHEGMMALVALGYGDGFFNIYSGCEIECAGQWGKIFGQINMDMSAVLFPLEAIKILKVGMPLEIWNHDPEKLYRFLDAKKLIAYELFCGMNSRVPRCYLLKS